VNRAERKRFAFGWALEVTGKKDADAVEAKLFEAFPAEQLVRRHPIQNVLGLGLDFSRSVRGVVRANRNKVVRANECSHLVLDFFLGFVREQEHGFVGGCLCDRVQPIKLSHVTLKPPVIEKRVLQHDGNNEVSIHKSTKWGHASDA